HLDARPRKPSRGSRALAAASAPPRRALPEGDANPPATKWQAPPSGAHCRPSSPFLRRAVVPVEWRRRSDQPSTARQCAAVSPKDPSTELSLQPPQDTLADPQ